MRQFYVSDPKPQRFGVSNSRAVEIYANKFGWTLKEAAKRILNRAEYEIWASEHQADTSGVS